MTSHLPPEKRSGLLKLLAPAAIALTLTAVTTAAFAQDSSSSAAAAPAAAASSAEPAAPTPTTVVATVGTEQITEADLAFAYEDLGQQVQQIPQDQLRAVLLAQVIDLSLFAQAGHAANVENSDTYKMRLTYLVDRALRRAYTKAQISDAITQDMIKAAYDKQVAALPTQDEVHARHILVSTEDDAKAIKAQLDAGADFATVAKAKSIEPGAKDSGGDLGYFTADKMVKPFADAAFALKVNEISQPIQTQFGWHVIQVLDRRPAPKPTLEELTPQIAQQLYIEKYTAMFNDLRAKTTITIPDAALKAQVDAQFGPAKP